MEYTEYTGINIHYAIWVCLKIGHTMTLGNFIREKYDAQANFGIPYGMC